MSFSVSSTIPEIAARFGRGIPPQLLDAGVAMIADSLAEPLKAAVEAETPVDTGALRASTDTHVIDMPGQAVLEARQTAENESGQYYAHWVFTQHRIVAWGHDTGRLSTPNEYPQRALARLGPEMDAAAHEATAATAVRIARILE